MSIGKWLSEKIPDGIGGAAFFGSLGLMKAMENPTFRGAAYGAALGGIGSAFSDSSSITGGAIAGATLGSTHGFARLGSALGGLYGATLGDSVALGALSGAAIGHYGAMGLDRYRASGAAGLGRLQGVNAASQSVGKQMLVDLANTETNTRKVIGAIPGIWSRFRANLASLRQ